MTARSIAVLLLALLGAGRVEAGWQSVVVVDLGTGEPAKGLRVRVQIGERVQEHFTSDKGTLDLRTGSDVQLESIDPAWKILPARVRVDEKLKKLAAHRYITVKGQVTAKRVPYLDETDIFVTFVDPTGKDLNVGSGGGWVHPWGIRTVYRVGIPDQNGKFKLRLPAVRGLALFARLEKHLAPIRLVPLKDHDNITLAMSPGLVVSGTVTDEHGRPVPNALVRMDIVLAGIGAWFPKHEANERFGGKASGTYHIGDTKCQSYDRFSTQTGADGRFQLVSPTDGDCLLSVYAEGCRPSDREVFWLDEPQHDLTFKLRPATDARPIPVQFDGQTKPGEKLLMMEFYPSHRPAFAEDDNFWFLSVTLDNQGRLPTEWFREGRRYSLSSINWKESTSMLKWPVKGPIKLRKDKH